MNNKGRVVPGPFVNANAASCGIDTTKEVSMLRIDNAASRAAKGARREAKRRDAATTPASMREEIPSMAGKLMSDHEIIRALRMISSRKRGHRGDWSMSAIAARTGLRRATLYDVCDGVIMTDRIRQVLSAALREVDVDGELRRAVQSGAGYMSVR